MELVLGSQGGELGWALRGEGRANQGVKLWPPPPRPSGTALLPLVLCEEDLRSLDDQVGPGFTIKDGFLGRDAVVALREEVSQLDAGGFLRPAAMRSQNHQRWADTAARGDRHMWLAVASLDDGDAQGWWAERPALRAACVRLRQLQEELCGVWGFEQGRVQAQLACYPGGGARYVRHLDAHSDTELKGQRRLTLLYYINPNWSCADGGCLRLYPKKLDERRKVQDDDWTEECIDVEPVGDRLLIFQSRTIEHELSTSPLRNHA